MVVDSKKVSSGSPFFEKEVNKMRRARIIISSGDAAGIGPELILRVCSEPQVIERYAIAVMGNRTIMERVSQQSAIPVPSSISFISHAEFLQMKEIPNDQAACIDLPFPEASTIRPGVVQAACGREAARWIRAAVEDIQSGHADALVTAPINKEAMHAAGVPFPGHTEMLAGLTKTDEPCMAFDSPSLFVSLATIHAAIRDVPNLLNKDNLMRTIKLTAQACEKRKGSAPRIGVLALNPHAGENGLFGNEEKEIITPAIEACRGEGYDVVGPLVPDTTFTWLFAHRPAPCDGYVAMYHDQALILFKSVAFNDGVNVTLGLPIIRTSPDHGTAFDLAWKGKATEASLLSAIRLAAKLAN